MNIYHNSTVFQSSMCHDLCLPDTNVVFQEATSSKSVLSVVIMSGAHSGGEPWP